MVTFSIAYNDNHLTREKITRRLHVQSVRY